MAEKLITLKNDVAYLSDIFFMVNEANKQLQGNNMTMVKCKNVITSFITKLELFRSNVSHGELRQFSNLIQNQVSTEGLVRYSGHLEKIKKRYGRTFRRCYQYGDTGMDYSSVFGDLQQVPTELQESLID